MTLRSYLVALALATLLPVALFAAVIGYFLVDQQRDTFRRGAEERTLAFLTAVDAELQGSIDTIRALSLSASLAEGNLSYFRATAARVMGSQPGWLDVHLAQPDGTRLLDLLVPEGVAAPAVDTAERSFQQVLQGGRPAVGDLEVSRVTKRWAYSIRVPVFVDGKVKFVLSASVQPSSMERLMESQGLPRGWVGVILDGKQRIVARTVDAERAVGQLASPSLRDALALSSVGWFRGATIEGDPVYTPYRRSAESGWAFAIGIPAAALDGAAWRAAGMLVAGLVAAVALALLLARFVGRRMSAPMVALAAATDAIGRGERVPVPQSAAIDELSRLARTLQSSTDAMREREERLRLALEAGRMGGWEWDVRTNQVRWSPELEALHGLAPGSFSGTFDAYEKDIHPEDRGVVHHAISKTLAHGQHHVEYRIVRPDGAVRWVEGRGKVFRDSEGVPVRVVGVCTDVTERKEAEHALKEASRAKDEFLAMLSHELRNPLAALTTAAHVLKFAGPTEAAAIKARGVVERQTRHMARLVGDLLDISRVALGKVSLERERFNLADTIAGVVHTWRTSGRLERHVLDVQSEPVWVDADRARIEQIVSNLLDNAVKFTPAGRRITVTVRPEGENAMLSVDDEGEGLPPGAADRVFELFVQGEKGLDRGGGGLGVGLALVKRLTEMHGGTVSAASAGPGLGASFTVRLPSVLAPQQRPAAKPQGEATGARHILIIEDNEDTRQMLQAALSLNGHQVRAAADGATGLALAAQARPDLALIDIGLPDLDGYEVARRLRAAPGGRRMGLIALTGYGQDEDQRRAYDAGFDAHLTKPVAPERLKQVMAGLE
jgi:PAS domain S-box-containing protein